MNDEVVVDTFDFICITHETEWSQCKADEEMTLTQNDIEYHTTS